MCIRTLILIKNNDNKKVTRREKAKETKQEKRVSLENLTRYDGIVREFTLCNFNLFDRVIILS